MNERISAIEQVRALVARTDLQIGIDDIDPIVPGSDEVRGSVDRGDKNPHEGCRGASSLLTTYDQDDSK